MTLLHGLFGLLGLIGIAWLLGENRRTVRPGPVVAGLAMQWLTAVILLRFEPFGRFFVGLNEAVIALQAATRAGAGFVFGYLAGGPPPFAETGPGANFILAFQVLPLILVVSALSALLFHWRVIPWFVRGMSWLLQRSLGIGGALGVGASANVFLSMVESPLLVRPYLARMTRAELFALMSCGMATIAGTMLVIYVTLLGDYIPDAAAHVFTASVISIPAALTLAGVMVPETAAHTAGDVADLRYDGAMDAVTRGTSEGLHMLLHVVAMLLVLVALVHLANGVLGLLPDLAGEPVTLQRLLGWVMAPVAWLMGIPWAEAPAAGALLGIKTVLNEFIAYRSLTGDMGRELGATSRIVLSYALCGFANFGSLGILIGGLSAMVPERRGEIAALGMRAMIAGTLATCMTGAVAGLVV